MDSVGIEKCECECHLREPGDDPGPQYADINDIALAMQGIEITRECLEEKISGMRNYLEDVLDKMTNRISKGVTDNRCKNLEIEERIRALEKGMQANKERVDDLSAQTLIKVEKYTPCKTGFMIVTEICGFLWVLQFLISLVFYAFIDTTPSSLIGCE